MNNVAIRILLGVLKRNKAVLLAVLLLVAAAVTLSLLPPLVLEYVVDLLTDNAEVGLYIALLYFIFLLASGFAESGQNLMITVLGQRITHDLRAFMCEKLDRLPADYFIRNEAGKITARFVADVDAIDTLFTKGIISMLADAMKIIAIIAVIFSKSRGLGLLLIIIMPLMFILTRYFQKNMLTAQVSNRAAIAQVNNHIPETLFNMRMIRNMRAKRYMEERYAEYIDDSYRALTRANWYDSIYSPIIIFTSSFVIGIMAIAAASGGEMREFFGIGAGTAAAIIAYVNRIFSPLENMGMEIQNIQSAIAGIKRIGEFLAEPEREMPSIPAERIIGTESENIISLREVSFAYRPEQPIFENISFDIKKGENIVFIGRTGAGKSTIFRLLQGLYIPQSGEVLINGISASSVTDKEKRRLIGYVEQNCPLIEGSIANQLTLGDETISHEEIENAAAIAGIDAAIKALPKGYDTLIEQAGLSQGQRQLLAIARAIVQSPPILLLDEITANLDSDTEAKVLQALEKACEGRTVLSVSHRMQATEAGQRVIYIG